jgi:transcriptional regulator with XRE-family HTH domain
MARKPTYIRAWRDERGYTLDDMVGRMDVLGVKITGASLSRIERGIQPYSQDILEAIAEALNVTVAQLTEHNPKMPPAKIYDFLKHLNADEAKQADAVLRAMFGKAV